MVSALAPLTRMQRGKNDAKGGREGRGTRGKDKGREGGWEAVEEMSG